MRAKTEARGRRTKREQRFFFFQRSQRNSLLRTSRWDLLELLTIYKIYQ